MREVPCDPESGVEIKLAKRFPAEAWTNKIQQSAVQARDHMASHEC